MVKLQFSGVQAQDRGYGLEIGGMGSLDAIISKALGTKSADGKKEAGYGDEVTKEGLKCFKSNNCDILVIINPHPQDVLIESDDFQSNSYEEFNRDLEARENEFKEKNQETDPEE